MIALVAQTNRSAIGDSYQQESTCSASTRTWPRPSARW
jgi:hypothetical protein